MIIPVIQILAASILVSCEPEKLPSFEKMKRNYPGYLHHGGRYTHNKIVKMIGLNKKGLLHDTSALRMSFTLNKVGGIHSLGKNLIKLSTSGRDSVLGKDGLQYLYHPLSYGPFMADRYGFPTVSKLHMFDPVETKKNFWGKQGIVQVITYTKHGNFPKGHIALWDCDHFHETPDWIFGHSLISVEFWETPDSDCSAMKRTFYEYDVHTPDILTNKILKEKRKKSKLLRNVLRSSGRRIRHHK